MLRLRAFSVVLTLLAVSAAGFVGLRLWQTSESQSGQPGASPTPGRHQEGESPEVLAKSLPQPSDPLPATPQAALEEIEHLVGWLVARFPADPDSYEVEARVRFWLGDSAAAVQCWEKCLALNANYVYAYHGMGLVAAKKGEQEKAVSLFRRVTESAPQAPAPQIDLASSLMALGRMEEAVDVLERHVKLVRDSVQGRVLLGKAYLNLNRPALAKTNYQMAVAMQPNLADGRFGLATALARLGESHKAQRQMMQFKELMAKEKEIRKAERSRPNDLDDLRTSLAATYLIVSQICGAVGAVREAEQFGRRAAALAPRPRPVLPGPEDPRGLRTGPRASTQP